LKIDFKNRKNVVASAQAKICRLTLVLKRLAIPALDIARSMEQAEKDTQGMISPIPRDSRTITHSVDKLHLNPR